MDNKEFFFENFREQLWIGAKEGKYLWSINRLPQIFEKLKAAILSGNFDKDGFAVKQTCKILNIKNTYKAINEYLNGRSA